MQKIKKSYEEKLEKQKQEYEARLQEFQESHIEGELASAVITKILKEIGGDKFTQETDRESEKARQ
jgi:hypothetical protein